MLQIELLSHTEIEKAATIFNRDGFVAIKDALTYDQLKFAKSGAQRVIKQQTEATELEKANRGFAPGLTGSRSTRCRPWPAAQMSLHFLCPAADCVS